MRWWIAGSTVAAALILGILVFVLVLSDTPDSDDSESQPVASLQSIQTSNLVLSPSHAHTNPWAAFALIFMSIATLVSVSITFYLYKWRQILIGTPGLSVPEKWGKYLKRVSKEVTKVSQTTALNTDKVTNMIETFMTLQNVIDERDKEIKRLKKGYDADIFNKFLRRFIRVDQMVDACLQSEKYKSESLGQIKRLMEDALDECGVESFLPVVGEDSRRTEGISDNPKIVKTMEKDDDFKITEVIEPGYRLRVGKSHDVLIPAKVRIYVFEI